MKTLNEIYAEVSANGELKNRFLALKTPEELAAFVKEFGGEASAEEIAAFLDKKNNKYGELSDEELDQVVGGKGGSSATYIHDGCGGEIYYVESDGWGGVGYQCNRCYERHGDLSGFVYHEE